MKLTHALTFLALASSVTAFAQTCYVDMVDVRGRVITSYASQGDPSDCKEAMKECRMTIRLQPHLQGADCVRDTQQGQPVPMPVPVPVPVPQPVPAPLPQHPVPAPVPSCGVDRPCGQVYTRLQALKALQAAENTNEDAEGNLHIVMRASTNYNLSLYEATTSFNQVLRLEGGSGHTSNARSTYQSLLNKSSQHSISLSRLIDALEDLIRSENTIDDGRDNLENVLRAVTRGQPLEYSVRVFNDLLRNVGNGNTSEARTIYQKFINNLHIAHLEDQKNAFIRLSRAENTVDDASGNFDLVLRATAVCGSIEVAASDFIETLRTVGGSGQTSDARRMYRTLYGI